MKETKAMAVDKKVKPHMMYSKAGKGVMVTTKKRHLELKAKGYSHTKSKNKAKVKKVAKKSMSLGY